ncbi:MAG: hypothetical protein RIA65_01725 [Woeseia sp.]
MNRKKLALYLSHYGYIRTLRVYSHRALQRIIDFDIMRVETTSGEATGSSVVEPYVTRQVTADEYRNGLQLLGAEHDRSNAFDRGDRCFANLFESQLVGYQFYAARSTTVRGGLEFEFPDSMTYAYASFTHEDHRGKKLARSRANARRYADQAEGVQRKVIWYISVDNLPSLAVSRRLDAEHLGYVGYVKIGRRFFCYASPACKRAGVSLLG